MTFAGHGWGVDEDNCAEFCDHSHHFAVNGITGPELTKSHPTAGNDDGCKTQVPKTDFDEGKKVNQVDGSKAHKKKTT